MKPIIEQQASEIHYIVKLLSLDTEKTNDVLTHIDSIKLLASSLIKKCEVIEREMYALAE